MNSDEQTRLYDHLSGALDLLWIHYGNGWETEKATLIEEIQKEMQRILDSNFGEQK
jgi:hypothetical protein